MTRRRDGVLPEPWDAFLRDVDAALSRATEIHCLGGFVLRTMFDLPRPTADVDFVAASPHAAARELVAIAGKGSPLHGKHGLYVDFVSVSDFPDDYASRLVDIAPGTLSKLQLRALAVEDLVLAKLTRNSPKDLFDVRFLARRGAIDVPVLVDLYATHLRPYLANEQRHDLTFRLWVDEIEAAQSH